MHFYDRNGEPRHFVPMKTKEGLRPTRINDAKKELWVPSVTTILNVLDKAALTGWKVNQHLLQAYKVKPDIFPSVDAYLAEVKRLTELEMDKAPSAGTDFHSLMEDFVNGDMSNEHELWEMCHSVYWEIERATGFKNDDGTNHYATEIRFASTHGYGGCVDLSISNQWIIDYKTKQTADKFKPGKMAYPDHARQLAAYRYGLGVPKARCANVFVCLETGEADFHEHAEADLVRGWETFQDCLRIWKRENYDPAFQAEAA